MGRRSRFRRIARRAGVVALYMVAAVAPPVIADQLGFRATGKEES